MAGGLPRSGGLVERLNLALPPAPGHDPGNLEGRTAWMVSRFAALTPLLAPRSVAIIGASGDPTRIGGRPIKYMKLSGFKGDVWPVNPNRPEVQGLKAYPSVADLPGTPDVAIIAVPAAIAQQAVEDLGRRGAKAAIMFTAGFAEVDPAGEAAQDKLVVAARAHGMRLLGPNCLGVFDGRTGYYAT
ncbi:MAG: CoA-binding protein, partial [Acetobacteraceae bacterium]